MSSDYKPPIGLLYQFKKDLRDFQPDDPSNLDEWFSFIYSWAASNGLSPEEAVSFCEYIRFHTDLF